MTLLRFTRLAALALSLVCSGAFAQGAAAGAWPTKPIKWIIPYTPGGITDNATRMVLQHHRITPLQCGQAMAVALTYDLARALAVVGRVGHETRKTQA